MASTASSQTTVLDKGDTSICFTLPKAKFLLKRSLDFNKLNQLNSICETRRLFLDSAYNADEKAISDQSLMIKNNKEAFELEEYKIQKLTEEVKSYKNAVNRQKVYKWIAIIAGSGSTAYFGTNYLLNKFGK